MAKRSKDQIKDASRRAVVASAGRKTVKRIGRRQNALRIDQQERENQIAEFGFHDWTIIRNG